MLFLCTNYRIVSTVISLSEIQDSRKFNRNSKIEQILENLLPQLKNQIVRLLVKRMIRKLQRKMMQARLLIVFQFTDYISSL